MPASIRAEVLTKILSKSNKAEPHRGRLEILPLAACHAFSQHKHKPPHPGTHKSKRAKTHTGMTDREMAPEGRRNVHNFNRSFHYTSFQSVSVEVMNKTSYAGSFRALEKDHLKTIRKTDNLRDGGYLMKTPQQRPLHIHMTTYV